MPEIDQRSGPHGRDADRPPGILQSLSLGRTALTAWALAAVLGVATVGTAVGAPSEAGIAVTPVADSTTTPMGTLPGGPAAGGATPLDSDVLGPFGIAQAPAMGTVTSPSIPDAGLKTVTAPSFPTVTIAPVPGATPGTAGTAGAPGPAITGGGTAGSGVAAPAGPAAALRQAQFTTAAPDNRASVAIRTALAQLGLPYVWGGDGPVRGDAGFDCSGLTSYSYGTAGVLLPRTAATQYNAGPHVPADAPLQPGDLVFYGTPARVHHVGMYLGDGRMVNAPTFGQPVQVAFYRYRGDDYLGATRPAAAGGPLTSGLLPEAVPVPIPDVGVSPAQQAQEQVFPAPTASLPPVLPQPGDPTLPSEQQSAAKAVAESDAVTVASGRTVVPQAVTVAPSASQAGTGTSDPSRPLSGSATATSSSTPAPVAPSTSGAPAAGASAPASSGTPGTGGVVTSSSVPTPAPGTGSPAGTATSASSTTAPAHPTGGTSAAGSSPATTTVLGAPTSTPPTSTATSTVAPTSGSPAPGTPVKAAGSSTATTTLLPTVTSTAKPVATKTSRTTVTTAPTATGATTAAKASPVATTPDKPVATKPDDDDPTSTTKASASKSSTSTSSATKSSASKTSASKTKASSATSSAKSASTKKSSSDDDSSDGKDGSSGD